MSAPGGKRGNDFFESREEAMEGIASALDFLRRETAALGMHEISDMIGRIRVRVRDHRSTASGTDD